MACPKAAAAKAIERSLRDSEATLTVKRVGSKAAFLDALESFAPDAIAMTWRLRGFTALEAVQLLQRRKRATPLIVVVALDGKPSGAECVEEVAVAWLRVADLERLPAALRRSMRKGTEEALRESEERYRAFLSQSSEGIWRYEVEQPIPLDLPVDEQIELCYRHAYLAECNDAMARMYGFSRAAELVGARLGDLMPHSDPRSIEHLRAFAAAGHRMVDAESHEVAKDGSERYFLNNMIAVIEHGKVARVWGTQRDITERKRAEDALRASEARYRLLFEANPHPMWVYDLETLRFLAVNDAAIKHYGYTRDEFLRMTIKDIRPAEDVPRLPANVAAITDGVDEAGEWRHCKKDGTVIDVEITSHTLDFAGRRAEVVLAHDVTARRRAEEAAQESEARFRSAFVHAPIGVALVSTEGRFLQVNQACCDILAYPEQELLATGFQALVHPDDLQACLYEFRRLLAGDVGSAHMETRHVRKNGEVIWILLSASPVCDAHGRILYFIAQIQDVTERRRAEEALRQSEERYRLLFENNPQPMFVFDLESLEFLAVNEAAVRHYGYSREEFLAMTIKDIRPAEDVPLLMELLSRMAVGYYAVPRPVRHCKKDGTPIDVEIVAYRFQHRGKTSVLVTVHDVTERLRAERERQAIEQKLLETQKLESLGVLAGGIAHDFNNLLAAILGNVSLAGMQTPPESPTRPYLTSVEVAAHRAADLCKQMLAYSGKGHFVVQHVNLNTLINEMANLLRVSIGKGILLKLNLAPSLPVISGDATQLRQVVMNLIINASEAIGDSPGAISLATGVTRATRAVLADTYLAPELPEADYLFLEVTDTGCGMDAATRARIFDPFFSTKFTGRGLGLAAVLGIVRGHGGAVKVESAPGQGSTFRVLLPCL